MGEQGEPTSILFHYIKSNYHRPIYVEGIFGGITPRGLLQMSVFSEHDPIPQQSLYCVNPDGSLGAEQREARVSRQGFVRDVEATLLLSENVAKSVHQWLGERLADLEKIKQEQQQRKALPE